MITTGQEIKFGVPVTDVELNQMYRLRHDRYVEKGYIMPQQTGLDIDHHDRNNDCEYIAAMIDGQIIGTVRLIVADPLPTESYFLFQEPEILSGISRERRGEVSRLVVAKGSKGAQHMTALGLICTLYMEASRAGIEGGYLYVKPHLARVLQSLGIPLHSVGPYAMQCDPADYMSGYFLEHEQTLPFAYLAEEVGEAMSIVINLPPAHRCWRKVS